MNQSAADVLHACETWVWAALACAVLIVVGTRTAQGGVEVWTSHGPYGRGVTALAIDPHIPSTLYAATSGGVFRSTDSGASWSPVITGLTNTDVKALAIDPMTPSTLYAGTWGGGGVFQSTNSGASWSPVNTGLTANTNVNALAIDPMTPSTLYAGTQGDGTFKSTNSGASWSPVNTGLDAPAPPTTDAHFVYALAIDPAAPRTLYAGTGGGVFKSTDGGARWSTTGLPYYAPGEAGTAYWLFDALAIDPHTPSTLYVGTSGGGSYGPPPGAKSAYKSTDSGASWSVVDTGLTDPSGNALIVAALAIDPHTPSTLYAATSGGVFQSTDSGASWSSVNAGLINTNVNALAIDPTTPSTLYAGTGGGVFGTASPALPPPPRHVVATCTETALDAALADGGFVTFDCGPAPVTITLTREMTIWSDTTVDGGGLITLDGNHAVRVFTVTQGVALSIENLAIVNALGGAILNNSALRVTNSTFAGNTATALLAGSFGAIENVGPGGTLAVMDSTFTGNAGGAIANGGSLTVTNSTFTGNTNYVVCGFRGCSGRPGSAIYSGSGTLTVINSTFTGNHPPVGIGGATIANSVDSRMTIINTIVANDPSGDVACSGVGSIAYGRNNLIGDGGASCGFADGVNGNIVGDPMLDAAGLKDNGGPTETVALQAGSPAIDAGDETTCSGPLVNNLDQRGYGRPATGCSIGAYEYNSVIGPTATFTPTSTPTPTATDGSCVGDCNGSKNVTVNELLTLVNIVLGTPASCPSGVSAGTSVDVSLMLQAVNNALSGCGGE